MTKILLLICTLMFLESYSCWVMTDVNTDMFERDLQDVLDDDEMEDLERRISFIFPGTKWCGTGNSSQNYDDLGSARETDMCCREHDHCPDVIPGGETKYNLTNTAFYSRLSCACDNKFYDCLKAANTKTAKMVGKVYFNTLQTKCFREEYPTVKCVKKGGWFSSKCLEYTYDTNGQKSNQWFDVNDF